MGSLKEVKVKMSNEVERKVKQVIQNAIGIKPEEIKPDSKLYDSLGVDSTEMVEINIALEKTFGIKLATDEVTKFSSFDDIVKVITIKKGA